MSYHVLIVVVLLYSPAVVVDHRGFLIPHACYCLLLFVVVLEYPLVVVVNHRGSLILDGCYCLLLFVVVVLIYPLLWWSTIKDPLLSKLAVAYCCCLLLNRGDQGKILETKGEMVGKVREKIRNKINIPYVFGTKLFMAH